MFIFKSKGFEIQLRSNIFHDTEYFLFRIQRFKIQLRFNICYWLWPDSVILTPKNFNRKKKKTVEISRESWMNKGQEKGLAYHVSIWLKSLKINFHIKAAHVILHTYFGHYFLCYHNEMRPKVIIIDCKFMNWIQI